MQVALYVHPFDLDALHAQGGLSRLRDLGIHELVLATSYHDGRWLTPSHPQRRVRFLEDGTVHFRPGGGGGAYAELQPEPSTEVPATGPSPLERLCKQAPAAGMRVRAWTVFGHNTRLGAQHLHLCVENAFGDRYPYALCPAQPEVQHYHATLVQDLAAHDGLTTIEFEALGQMGINHSSHHDKKSFTPKGLLEFALSACFCPACCARHRQSGVDPDPLRQAARAIVTRYVTDADAMAPDSAPSSPAALDDAQRSWVDAVLAGRKTTIAELVTRIVPMTGACQRAVQVHPDPWFTGSQLSVASAAAFPTGDERVYTCYGEDPTAIGKLLASEGAEATKASPRRLCIWPKAPQFTGEDDLRKIVGLCREHGLGSIAIYHLGLLPRRTLERAAAVLTS